MTYFKIFLFIFINCIVTQARISDKRLCADPNCSEPISLAKTVLSYASNDNDRRVLSFPKNVDVKIFSKAAGSRSDLWGVEINGKRGYVPISHIRETKILKTKVKFLVSTDDDAIKNSAPTIHSEVPSQESILQTKSTETVPVISPNSVTPPHEVIDGTTVYYQFSNDEVSTPANTPVENTGDPVLSVTPDRVDLNNLNSNVNTAGEKEIIDKEKTEKQVENEGFQNEELVRNKDGLLDNISKLMFQNIDGAEVSDEDDEENASDENEEVEDDEEDVLDELESSKTEAKTSASASITDKLFDEDGKKSAQTDTEVSSTSSDINVNQNTNENEEIITPSTEAGKDNMDQLQDANASQLLQNNTANVEVIENPVAVTQNTQNSEEMIVKEPVYKNFYGVPSNFLRNSFNALSKNSAEVTDEHQMDTVNSQMPDSALPSEVNEDPSLFSQLDVATTPELPFQDIPVPYPDTFTESTVTENPVDINIKNVENLVENDQSSGQNNELLNNDSTENINTQEIIHNNTLEEEKLNSTDNNEQPMHTMENTNAQENLTSPEEIVNDNEGNSEQSAEYNTQEHNSILNDEKDNSAVILEQPEHSTENINLQEVNETTNEEKINNSAENFEQSGENSVLDFGNPILNEKNSEIETTENNISTESLTENDSFNSEMSEESVTVGEQDTEKVEMPVENSDQSDEQSGSDGSGFFMKIYSSVFGASDETRSIEDVPNIEEISVSEEPREESPVQDIWITHAQEKPADKYTFNFDEKVESTPAIEMQSCQIGEDASSCPVNYSEQLKESTFELADNAYSIFLYLSLTSVTLLLFILGYYYIEKKRHDGSLIVSINELEKNLLISSKECLLLQDELNTTKERLSSIEDSSFGSNEMVTALKEELEDAKNSGNEHLMQNIEHLQKQLNEQQVIINNMNSTLCAKTTENELLQTELTVAHEKITQLQGELDKMVVNLLSVQEEKCKGENEFDEQTRKLKNDFDNAVKSMSGELNVLKDDNTKLKSAIDETQRALDVKNNEYALLKEGMKDVQAVQSNKDSLKALLDVSKVKAEVQQLRQEKHKMAERFQVEIEAKQLFEKEVQVMMQEVQILKDKFEEAEREKIEAQTRLEVLSGSQNELLKKEILDQEVSLKSQISMLERKSHDNWVLARQAERRVEESKQEASQLRNRLTIVEKNLNNASQVTDESKIQNRIMSPLESNGEIPVSPLHMSNVENPGSPPLMFPHRDHMTTSPPIPGMPPFMPPPPGVPFMPPPMPGVPPFMPPPPALFPGDHRPPPLGRMSSPPLYSPDSRAYSPYDRDDSPPLSPTYTDSDYRRRSPPPPTSSRHMPRNYSPYNSGKGRHSQWEEDRDYRGQQQRNKPRTLKGPGLSSGQGIASHKYTSRLDNKHVDI
ncbi:Transport and Golgi organization 1 [Carabus blaptoides fortunei]